MPLSEDDRRILEQLEQSFGTDKKYLARVVRAERRRRALIVLATPAGLLIGLVGVLVGVAVGHPVGVVVGVAGYPLAVASASSAVVLIRRQRMLRRGNRSR